MHEDLVTRNYTPHSHSLLATIKKNIGNQKIQIKINLQFLRSEFLIPINSLEEHWKLELLNENE